ncbi:LacI family transcriptional regulator [Rhizobium leguminosarum bv. viciae]|nr:LacI family transcriptional regulator [Rhizobium leguminosarum bv. viciae]
MNQMKATMADIARLAKVSPTTAARVIHNNGYVSQENRQKVLEAVEVLGYRPNLQARSLRTQRSFSLGLILSAARENPFYTQISHAIRTAAMERGYSMLTVNHSYSQDAEAVGVQQFLDHNVEAVILCHALNLDNIRPLTDAGIPIIQIERHDLEMAHFVELDPAPGMTEAVDTLAALGHRRIAFVGGSIAAETQTDGPSAEKERIRAFQMAAASAGLVLEDCPVVLGPYDTRGASGRLPGYVLADELLRRSRPIVSAIITGSDVLAAGVLQALYERAIRVPEEVSVIGYDDSFAQFLSPPLTSIAQPYDAIGQAVMTLVETAQAMPADAIAQRMRVGTQLVSRASIGRAGES